MEYIELKGNVLKQLHQVQLEILDEIIRICDKNSLKYFFTGGTLLGAVRHKGYIPWDDDLDIAMPRKDYDKFLELCKKELNANYLLDYHKTNNIYWLPFAKIRKKGTIFREKSIEHLNVNKGIYVDIFPMDNIKGGNSFSTKFQAIFTRIITYTFVYKASTMEKDKIPFLFFVKILSMISWKNLHNMQDYIAKLYNNKQTDYFMNFSSPYHYKKEILLKSEFFPLCELKFEKQLYKCPKNFDYYLTKIYGDYMKLPPKEKRINHSAVAIDFGKEK